MRTGLNTATPAPPLDEAAAVDLCRAAAPRPCRPARVGVELELLTTGGGGPDGRLSGTRIRSLAGRVLGRGSRVSVEPGGQLELSGPPCTSASEAVAVTAADLAELAACVSVDGVGLHLRALDVRPPRRVLRAPRYDAMEEHFAALGPAGATGPLMMCNTAAVQVNVDVSEAGWRHANLLGPVLVAVTAASPTPGGSVASRRMDIWWRLDPTRTRPVPSAPGPGAAWAAYALAAPVMTVNGHGRPLVPRPPLRFGDWLRTGHRGRFPTAGDLDRHLTTLFPPVRPRRFAEVRVCDVSDQWPAVVALVAALLTDDEAGAAAVAAARAAGVTGRWREAITAATRHPGLRRAARACVEIAMETLGTTDPAAAALLGDFADRFTRRGLCPADVIDPAPPDPGVGR